MKFRTRPVEVEAFRLGVHGMPQWFLDGVKDEDVVLRDHEVELRDGYSGWHIAERGDWIIKDASGKLYPCKSGIFEATHDAAD